MKLILQPIYCSIRKYEALLYSSFILKVRQGSICLTFVRWKELFLFTFYYFDWNQLLLWIFFQLHFGVNSGTTRFALEKQAINEATFRCPDELGWKPQVTLIVLFTFMVSCAYIKSPSILICSFSLFQLCRGPLLCHLMEASQI